MTDETTPSQRAGLRDEIAQAIHRYDNHHALSGNDIPSRHHRGEADAVIALLHREWPWLRAEAEELAEARAALARVQALAVECPAGIDTALIDEALDGTQPAAWTPPPPGSTREQLPDHLLALIEPGSYRSTAEPDDTELTEADTDRMMADSTPVPIDPNAPSLEFHAYPAAAEPTDRATRLDTLARDILSSFVPTRDSTGMHVTHHQARALPHEMKAWQDALDETEQP